ncbi:hypothetical protein WICMUC_005829 [Wickerhamomyces mucosus]|uniref:Major facilitator superfamily (MFS) profile domain-containing protein n=1 Tax=Wickerhamomyces mucosus TaxID=1378264 RepID=A0A9P8T3R0_9ASCO|nr:hypothetical protein WICMUC_005829 [Wickerhamomyces mucosus]
MDKTEFIEDVNNSSDKVEILHKKTSSIDDDFTTNNVQIDEYLAKFIDISSNAQANEQAEKKMTLKEGLKTFPKAALWSIALSTAIIMEGYDTNLLNSFYSFPAFNKKYGQYYESLGTYQIPAKWQTSLSMAVYIGEIIGLFVSGIIADRIGYRKTLMGALVATTGFIFIVFFSVNIQMLLAGEILLGIPWGMFQTLTISYASEVCPLVLRIYLTTYVNVCWVIGQLISSGILRGVLNSSNEHAYRIPFAIQWVWPLPIITAIYFAPESPWWLAKKGRYEEAKNSVNRLLTPNKNLPNTKVLSEAIVSQIQLTLKEENEVQSETTTLDCFKGTNLRRTRIASIIWVIQNVTGSALMGYSTYFYLQAGLSESMSFTFSIIQYVLGLLGTLLSWILSQRFGRFDIFFGGLLINFCILIVVGGLGFSDADGAKWAVGSLLLLFTFVYDASIGPITYCVVAEIPSSSARTKTVTIARNFYNLSAIPISIITPYMLNPTAWNWKGKTGLFWAAFALCGLIWSWFEFPETKGRTFAELDILFKEGVKARNFKKTEVETFNTQKLINKMGDKGIKDLVDANKVSPSAAAPSDIEEQVFDYNHDESIFGGKKISEEKSIE